MVVPDANGRHSREETCLESADRGRAADLYPFLFGWGQSSGIGWRPCFR